MIIAIASGKGGTGKTTVAVNLAYAFDCEIQLLDCDVEEPNVQLFLKGAPLATEEVAIPVPQIDESLCDGCGECSRFCEYNAIVSFGTKPLVFADMCHGCGGCMKVCPRRAIREIDNRIGVIETFRAGKISLIQGRLDVGAAMAPPLIRAVKRKIDHKTPAILDAPPGTSCPVITTLRETDFVALVTEPTPFGLNDLILTVEAVREMHLPFGIIINRAGSGDERVNSYCDRENIPILAEIPDSRQIAEAYSRGELIGQVFPEYRRLFVTIINNIITRSNRSK
ncbi:MAG: ATP-binding protein [Candidatus Marinimicrobia bacterium]|nr:ATP-binding protein [Candidatus Neomarinimicrobiota bacterium]MDD5230301.1 ATP-binding protein [Candidatus Neomarinimicrobiota bacterium]